MEVTTAVPPLHEPVDPAMACDMVVCAMYNKKQLQCSKAREENFQFWKHLAVVVDTHIKCVDKVHKVNTCYASPNLSGGWTLHAPIRKRSNLGTGVRKLAGGSVITYRCVSAHSS